jgi:hypothetical protein
VDSAFRTCRAGGAGGAVSVQGLARGEIIASTFLANEVSTYLLFDLSINQSSVDRDRGVA